MGEIKAMFIGLLVVSAIIIGISGFYGDISNKYAYTLPTATNESITYLNVMKNISAQSEALNNVLSNTSIIGNNYFLIISSAIQGILMTFSLVPTFGSMISSEISTILRVPPEIGSIILVIIIMVFVFAAIEAYLKVSL